MGSTGVRITGLIRFGTCLAFALCIGFYCSGCSQKSAPTSAVEMAAKNNPMPMPPGQQHVTGTAPMKAASPGAETPTTTPPTGSVTNGATLYTQYCIMCHHYDAQGDGSYSTMTYPPPANLTAVMDSPTMIRSIIRYGIQGTAMPAHRYFREQDYSDVLTYIKSQPLDTAGDYEWAYPWLAVGKPVAPDLAKTLYTTTCSGCHGVSGDGQTDAIHDSSFWPKPANFHARNSDIGRLYWIVTNGLPGTMMAPQRMKIQTDEVRWALAQYVHSFFSAGSTYTIPTGPMMLYSNPRDHMARAGVVGGMNVFNLYCAPCHGDEANGTFLAPKLSDRLWRYGGGTDNAVYNVVLNGIPGKLMPGHRTLSRNQRWAAITYLRYRGGHAYPLAGQDRLLKLTGVGKEVQVTISGLKFNPTSVVVTPGTTIVWKNEEQTAHTTTSDSWRDNMPGSEQPYQWNSGVLNPGETYRRRFDKPGVTRYFCAIHPTFMRAQVVVRETP